MSRSEFELIEHFFARHTLTDKDVVLGIGDDAAVLNVAEGQQLVVSTDTLVAGVHFPESASAEDIGHKLLAVNLSDMAAMGAQPRWISLALTLPEPDETWLTNFCQGLFNLASQHGVSLIGGDTTRGPLTLSLTIHGTLNTDTALTRGAANVGDAIYVSGQLGDAGLALQHLLGHVELDETALELKTRLHRPEPRVELGQQLIGIASAAIDISDGLAADLGHILQASGVGASLQLEQLPVSSAVRHYTEQDDWRLPLSAGDDYELCFTVAETKQPELLARLKNNNVSVSRVGQIEAEAGCRYLNAGQPVSYQHQGYKHFS